VGWCGQTAAGVARGAEATEWGAEVMKHDMGCLCVYCRRRPDACVCTACCQIVLWGCACGTLVVDTLVDWNPQTEL
jgi:hypothetical protein